MAQNVYTVGQVSSYLRNMFTSDFFLKNIYVKGEVSNCKYHSSGHLYFTLKDKDGIINAVMFRGNRRGLEFTMEEGQKVIVLGEINVYEAAGRYQLYAKEIVMDGIGSLYKQFEERKAALEEMGMFAPEYKKEIPRFARRIGIVTAKTGAAVQDIINIAKRRNPYCELYLYPAYVQGENAVSSIVNGISLLDQMHLDVLIVGRGGGSIEDLWAFNEEAVARAIFECETPVISAVGHETDVTIADFVADLRAPTPSAAAELAVFDYQAFAGELHYRVTLLKSKMNRYIEQCRMQEKQLEARLGLRNPSYRLRLRMQQLDELSRRMESVFHKQIRENRYWLSVLAEKLDGLSPLKKISKGYAFVTKSDHTPLVSVQELDMDETITVTVKDGQADARVIKITEVSNGKE